MRAIDPEHGDSEAAVRKRERQLERAAKAGIIVAAESVPIEQVQEAAQGLLYEIAKFGTEGLRQETLRAIVKEDERLGRKLDGPGPRMLREESSCYQEEAARLKKEEAQERDRLRKKERAEARANGEEVSSDSEDGSKASDEATSNEVGASRPVPVIEATDD